MAANLSTEIPPRMMQPVHRLSRLLSRVLLVMAAVLALSSPVLSQTAADDTRIATARGAGPEVVAQQRDRIGNIEKQADQLARRMQSGAQDDAILVEVRNALEELSRELLASGVAFRPRLTAINNRLDEIGPPRADGEAPEPPALTAERQSLIDEKADINALLGQAETLSLRVNGMVEEIVRIRRDLFANTLSRRYDISVAISPRVVDDLAAENRKLTNALSSWGRFLINFKLSAVLAATFYALLAASILLIGGRRLLGTLYSPDPTVEQPSYLSRLSVAFWSTLLPSAAVAVFLAATYFFFNYYGLLRRDIAQLMVTLFNVIATVFFIYRLAAAVFSPRLPEWRLLPVRTSTARVLFWLVCLTALVSGLDFVTSKVTEVMASPLSLTVAKSFFATIIVGVLIIVIGLQRPFTDEAGNARGWSPLFRAAILILGGVTVVSALLGYIGLARFIAQQIVVTGAILATMYIGYLSAGAISEEGGFINTGFGKRLDKRFNFDETTEDQLGLLFSVLINVLVLGIGIPLIFLQWGFQWGDIQSWTYNMMTEIRIGSISISIIGILTGIFIFLVGYVATRGFQRWLDGKVMARGRVDAGVRNSISTAVGYAGIALAALLGISAAGIDLSNLALVAGALSLGIGFGLQNIVNNFVSGLILLAERPFKVGDSIEASGTKGTVRKISVRATEVETSQRQTVILPNSLLINAAVGNWTHRNRTGRVDIPVVASSENDARHVHALLLEIVRQQPGILKNPEPQVAFTGFDGATLNFEVRAVLPDITSRLAFTNELRFEIAERFKTEGIA
ncbi:mechanosensitive ion channel family protein [Mesorhizobium microcysteis]|jgi:potassium-dependent mechanosensitive channel|uniref:Mechanosensitive ion channel family protein n=2 Tax=Neoaquamicrobium microcysteis TaxID=2682781 RepID=A0A5D4GY18_9HYPH|nr:mechanosensitive ion channel family protein [Mesorhizobium microcysteis]